MTGFPREIRHPRLYRLRVRPTFTVSFPSIVYALRIRPVEGAPQYRLEAEAINQRNTCTIAQGGENLVRFEHDLYERGFEVMHPTLASTILEQLCREARAERITP